MTFLFSRRIFTLARSRRFPHQGRSRRATTWDSGPNQTKATLSATGKTIWTNGVTLVGDSEVTIVRTRGQLIIQVNLATSASDGMNGAVGLGIVSSEAFAAGAASVPGPFSQPDWQGWFWHEYWSVYGVAAQSAGQDVARNANVDQRIVIDSKAMRKLKFNEVIFGCWEVAAETGTAAIIVQADVRQLVKIA